MATLMKALPVYHLDRIKIENEEAAINHASRAAHLTKGATGLLLFYTKRSSGFTPSAEFTAKETGISRSQVFRARKELESKTLIFVKENGVYVNWNAIYTLQAAEPRYMSEKSVWNMPRRNETVAGRLVEAFKNEQDWNHLFNLMEFVSDSEYQKWESYMKDKLDGEDYFHKTFYEKEEVTFEDQMPEYHDEEFNAFMAQEIGPLPF